MAESMYQKWLETEKNWISLYCKRTIRLSIFRVIPLTLLGLMIFFGGMAYMNGGSEALGIGIFGGLSTGVFVCSIYLLILLMGLRSGRYVRKIENSVNSLSMSDTEKEQLGKEMLEALDDSRRVLSFKMIGPNVKGTPARFVATPHYVFFEGGNPYGILVRLSDINEVRTDSETKTAVTRGAKTKTYYTYTLYTIGFYRKDRFDRGLSSDDLPDEAMGFFHEDIRDKAVRLMKDMGIQVR